MSDLHVPARLLDAVRRDLRPVRPLASPLHRTLLLLPLALMMLFAASLLWGWRDNLSALNGAISWGLSALEVGVGLAILFVAFRESEPGRAFARAQTVSIFAIGIGTFLVVTFVTSAGLPTTVRAQDESSFLLECFWQAVSIALPALIAPLWLVARGRARYPVVAGALCGTGIGVIGDAGMRLYCWITEPVHVLLAHGSALLLAICVGACAAWLTQRWRDRLPL